MARVVFCSADGQERTYKLTGELKVGSAEDSDVVLDAPAGAPRQCRIVPDDQGRVWVEPAAGDGVRSELLAGQELGVGTWVVRLEQPPVLEVLSEGALHGQGFPWVKDRLVVGSASASDLCLAHESVSPRHAQLSRIGARLNLLDLGSAQGTFVNGQRVSSAQLTATDRICFGSVELGFAGQTSKPQAETAPAPAPQRPEAVAPVTVFPVAHEPVLDAAPAPSPRKSRATALLVAGGFAVAVAAVIIDQASNPEPLPVEPVAVTPTPIARFDPNRHQTECTSWCAPGPAPFDPVSCVKRCGDLLDADLAFAGMDAVQRGDRLAPGYVASASDRISEGKPGEALDLLRRVNAQSQSFGAAEELYVQAARQAAAEQVKECQEVVAGGLFEKAVSGACLRALELTCGLPGGPDPGALLRFHHAARSPNRPAVSWTCPSTLFTESFDASKAGDGGDPGPTLIRERYPNPRLAEIVLAYYRTADASAAIRSLEAAEPGLPVTERLLARDLSKYLTVISSRFAGLRGASNLMFVEQVRQAESRILPAGLHSAAVEIAEGPKRSNGAAPPVGDQNVCAGIKSAYDRSRPGSKERQRAADFARQAGCGAILPPTARAR
ncbi:MAG: FHA domain-containing protein [Myxococcales bacterium]